MGQVGTLITAGYNRVSALGGGLLKDMDSSKAACKPEGIDCNHPVFVYGHLAIYPQMVMGLIGKELGDTAVPESYTELFTHGAECKDDSDGSIYPSLEEVSEHCTRAYAALVETVQGLDDDLMFKDIEGSEGFKNAFGTNGAMINFMVNDHTMFHYGQVSTWRRAMGLASVM